MPKIYSEIQQQTIEWENVKLGKFTASHAATIATAGAGLETLCFDLVAEILTKKRKDSFQSPAMQRGNELENTARTLFELETGYNVEQVGFVEIDEFVGCSPDGLILDRTSGVEIKCPQDNTYAKYLFDAKIKPEYYAQMQMQMLLLDAKKWYYMVYNENFEKSFVIQEVAAEPNFQNKLVAGLDKGRARVKEILSKIKADQSGDFWTDFLNTSAKINDYRI